MEDAVRILISGVAGMIGSELASQLAAQGHDLIGNDDLSHNCVNPRDLPIPPQQMFPCRVEQLQVFRRSIGRPELIIHCASPVGHARLTPAAQIAWQIVSDTQSMLEFAERAGSRLIIFSSSEVLTYRGETDIRAQYSLGKLTSEAMALGHPKVDCRVVRPYNVTGRRQLADGGFVMARFRDAALGGKPLVIFGSGEQVRHFLHVSDFARFVCLLAERWPERKLWSVFNPANGVSMANLARMFDASFLHGDGATELGNPAWRDTSERPLDMNEFDWCQGLGWTPRVPLLGIVHEHLTSALIAHTNLFEMKRAAHD